MRFSLNFSSGVDSYEALILDGASTKTVLVLPDWRGSQTNYALQRAEELHAGSGCRIILSDLYGTDYRPIAYNGDAELWIQAALSNPSALRIKLAGYVQSLLEKLGILAEQLVVIGYCLGGALAFEMGRADVGLAAVASVHGIPSSRSPIALLQHKTRFLAIHGAADPIIGLEHLIAFQKEMDTAQVAWSSLIIGNTRHGFTDEDADSNGLWQRYSPNAAQQTLRVLTSILCTSENPA